MVPTLARRRPGRWPNGLAEMMRAKLDSIERKPEDDARLSAMVGKALR